MDLNNNMDVKIRKIERQDINQVTMMIKKVHRKSFIGVYSKELIEIFCHKYDLDNFVKRMKIIDYFVAEDLVNNKIVGVIGLQNNQLRTFFVDPDYQGKGVGSLLFQYLESYAKNRKFKELYLEGSPIGEPFYEHFGFVKIKTLEKQRQGIKYQDALMIKKL